MTDLRELLGARLDNKDERSRGFQAQAAPSIHTIMHRHYPRPLHQWLGSCTGHSAAQALNTVRLHKRRWPYKTDADAMDFYTWATQHDIYPGQMPEEDTGSSILAAAQAVRSFDQIDRFNWAFGYDHMLGALMLDPVVVGTIWPDNMFEPDSRGFLDVSGRVDSAHAYLILGYSLRGDYFTMLNSWGRWGRNGRAKIPGPKMRYLLEADGEALTYVAA
jgi:hypothetical protein